MLILGEDVVEVSACTVEGLGLDAEVLQHGGEEVVERGLATVGLLGIEVTFVLEAASCEDDGEVAV